jgi:hypothetical protein
VERSDSSSGSSSMSKSCPSTDAGDGSRIEKETDRADKDEELDTLLVSAERVDSEMVSSIGTDSELAVVVSVVGGDIVTEAGGGGGRLGIGGLAVSDRDGGDGGGTDDGADSVSGYGECATISGSGCITSSDDSSDHMSGVMDEAGEMSDTVVGRKSDVA